MAKAIEAGMPKLRIEEAAARTQARIDSGRAGGDRRQQVSAARARAAIDVLKVDNAAVRQLQIDKLARLKRERDPAAVADALEALTRGADAAATAICWRSPSTPPAPRRPSAKFRWRWKRCSAAITPRSRRSPASTGRRSAP